MMQDPDTRAKTPAGHAETTSAEDATGARRVGLWKILAVSLVIVLIGFAVVAALQPA